MYVELGGRSEYRRTPIRELQELRLSIIAEWKDQARQNEELKAKQEEQEREMRRQQQKVTR